MQCGGCTLWCHLSASSRRRTTCTGRVSGGQVAASLWLMTASGGAPKWKYVTLGVAAGWQPHKNPCCGTWGPRWVSEPQAEPSLWGAEVGAQGAGVEALYMCSVISHPWAVGTCWRLCRRCWGASGCKQPLPLRVQLLVCGRWSLLELIRWRGSPGPLTASLPPQPPQGALHRAARDLL